MIEAEGVRLYQITSGKLRRYLSFENFVDFFKVWGAFWQAYWILLKEKPQVLFSKGGYVSLPVAWAAWARGIPVVTHESDLVPGLATRLIAKVARKVCVSFRESTNYFGSKAVWTGNPVRSEILQGDKQRGYALTGFTVSKQTILVMGGSQGARSINEVLEQILPELVKNLQVVHITGKHQLAFKSPNYFAAEFLKEELKDIYAISDLLVARAGAATLFELAAVSKPSILIPLGPPASRGEQLKNAELFSNQGAAFVIKPADLNAENLLKSITDLSSNEKLRQEMSQKIAKFYTKEAAHEIRKILEQYTK